MDKKIIIIILLCFGIFTIVNISKVNAGMGSLIENIFSMDGNTIVLDGIRATNNTMFEIRDNAGNRFSIYAGRLSDNTDGFSLGTTSNSTFRIFQNNKDILTIDKSGNFLTEEIKIDPQLIQPKCDITNRGLMIILRGGISASDQIMVCLKDANNNFRWVNL